jgi:hypothetical protein
MNFDSDHFPFCLVWTPIPIITWVLPFVGHLGICSSKGVIFDFAGPYYIGEGELAFGKTTRYLPLKVEKFNDAAKWDAAVEQANSIYCKKTHQICFQNCHSHCATVLDLLEYGGFRHWNMIILAFWMVCCSSFSFRSPLTPH